MADAKLRVKSGIEVEVNDAGDKIVIPTEDALFVQRFQEMILKFGQVRDEVSQKMDNASREEQIKVVVEASRIIMNEIDVLLGENTCKKVFGDTVPSVFAISDFFEQLIPIVESSMNERKNRIREKYNRNRSGSKKPYRNRR